MAPRRHAGGITIRQLSGSGAAFRFHFADRGGREARQFLGRADWSPHEFAAAVRAASSQDAIRACRAECTLEAADPRIETVRRQIAVAAFTIGSKLEHWEFPDAIVTIPLQMRGHRSAPDLPRAG